MFSCFSTSVDSSFPTATLIFEGGVAMNVKPENYLLQQGSSVCEQAFLFHLLLFFFCHCLSCKMLMGSLVSDAINIVLWFAGRQCTVVHWLAKKPGNHYTWRLVIFD
jgi:hypothetical protein